MERETGTVCVCSCVTCRSWSMALFSSTLSREMRWKGREPVMSCLRKWQRNRFSKL